MEKKPVALPWLSALCFTRLRFYYQAVSGGTVNWFLGPEIRGSIGCQLKLAQGCRGDRNEDCQVCSDEKKLDCIFEKFFFNDNKPNQRIGLVLQIEPGYRGLKSDFAAGETLRFDLIMIGKNKKYWHHFLNVLKKSSLFLGENGVSFRLRESGVVDNRGKFMPIKDLTELPEYKLPERKFSDKNDLIKGENRLELKCLTPTELYFKYRKGEQGKKRLYVRDLNDLTFRLLVERLIRRTYDLAVDCCNWNGPGLEEEACKDLIDLSETINLSKDFSRATWIKVPIRNNRSRYSGGLKGNIIFEGDLMPFANLLTAAVYFGIGINITSGFGQVSYSFI